MRQPGGSRVLAVGAGVILGLTLFALAYAAHGAVEGALLSEAPPVPFPLGSSVGDFEIEALDTTYGPNASIHHAADLAPGCKVLGFANMCPAVVKTVHDLAAIRTVHVRDVVLPMFWIADAQSASTIGLLGSVTPANTFLVSPGVWHSMRLTFTPEFLLLDADGVLVATGWPDPHFLRSLPDPLQDGFAQRCRAVSSALQPSAPEP